MMHTKKTVDTFFLRTAHTKNNCDTFFLNEQTTLFKSAHKKLKSAFKKLKTAYKNHNFWRNGAPYFKFRNQNN